METEGHSEVDGMEIEGHSEADGMETEGIKYADGTSQRFLVNHVLVNLRATPIWKGSRKIRPRGIPIRKRGQALLL